MNKRCVKPMSVLITILSVAVAIMLSASDPRGEEILLRYKATVVEETKDHIIIKFQKRDIGLMTQRGKPTETLPEPPGADKSPLTQRPTDRSLSRAELKDEILQELREEVQKEVTRGIGPIEYGSVEGRIVRRGVGEPEARVKLVRWVEEASLLGVFKELKKGAEFETTTDHEGRYAFQKIPVGSYELKWLPRGGDAWIRRLTEKPDITVRKGAIVAARTVELSKTVLP